MTDDAVLPERTVTRHYAQVAWFYDLWARLTEERAVRRALELADLHDGLDVLEVAVGTGRLFRRVVERNPQGRNEGIDLSPEMLARARRRLSTIPAGSWNLSPGSAFDLPFPDASFDRLFNTYMLDLLPEEDFPRALNEFERVLRPGGRLILVTFGFGEHASNRLWLWLARHVPALLTNCRPVRPQEAVRNAGLEIVHSEAISQNTFPSEVLVAVKGG